MIVTCTYCFTKVETTDSNLQHPSYMEINMHEIRCPACTRLFKVTMPEEPIAKNNINNHTPWVHEWAEYRAVDGSGDLYEYSSKPTPFQIDDIKEWCMDDEDCIGKAYRVGTDYDASDWKNTLQERDGATIWYDEVAEIPEEVFDKLATIPEKKLCQYVNDFYHIPAYVGMKVWVEGVEGKIVEDRGHYIGVTFHDESAGVVHNFHPTSHGLVYDLPKKPTIAKQLEDRPWPQWAKDLFVKRCTEYGTVLAESISFSQCFDWGHTPEGIGFWDRLITRDTIKEEDIHKIKENKVEDTNKLKNDLLASIAHMASDQVHEILVQCAYVLKARVSDLATQQSEEFNKLKANFEILLEEKDELKQELKAYKKHMNKIMEAVSHGDA